MYYGVKCQHLCCPFIVAASLSSWEEPSQGWSEVRIPLKNGATWFYVALPRTSLSQAFILLLKYLVSTRSTLVAASIFTPGAEQCWIKKNCELNSVVCWRTVEEGHAWELCQWWTLEIYRKEGVDQALVGHGEYTATVCCEGMPSSSCCVPYLPTLPICLASFQVPTSPSNCMGSVGSPLEEIIKDSGSEDSVALRSFNSLSQNLLLFQMT